MTRIVPTTLLLDLYVREKADVIRCDVGACRLADYDAVTRQAVFKAAAAGLLDAARRAGVPSETLFNVDEVPLEA